MENKNEKKEFNFGELGVALTSLLAISPMAFPNLPMLSINNITSILTGVGISSLTGVSIYLILDLVKMSLKEDKDRG